MQARAASLSDSLFDFGSSIPPILAFCEAWDVGEAGPLENEPVRSDIPTLILAGHFDPITPPAWGQRVAGSLPNSVFVEFPADGHLVIIPNPCARAVVRSFLNDPLQPPDDSCVTTLTPLNFE